MALTLSNLQGGIRRAFKNRALAGAVLAALAMGGCMVGPDYHPPEVKTPTSWVDEEKPLYANVTARLAPSPVTAVAWWASFGDPKLDELVRLAADQNLGLLQAEARIRAARAAKAQVVGGLFPQVGSSASYNYGSSPTIVGGEPQLSPPTTGFRSGLDAAWELDIFGGTRRAVEAAQAQIQFAIEDRRDVLITLLGDVGTAYIDLRSQQELLQIARTNLEDQQHIANITRQRWEVGLVSELDYDNAKSTVDSTRASIPNIERNIHTDIYVLSVLLGRDPNALLQELTPQVAVPSTPGEIPIGLPADLIRRRPDIRRAEATLHADTANVGAAIAQFYPSFTVSGSFGFQGVSIGQMTQWAAQTWSWGPTINWPIFAGGSIAAQVEIQRATLQASLYAYRQTVLTALQEVETSRIAFTKEQERRAALRDVVYDNQRAMDISLRLYQEGNTEFINVLNAEISLSSSQNQLAVSNAAVATNLVALYKALGGGWSEFPERDAVLIDPYRPPPQVAPRTPPKATPGPR